MVPLTQARRIVVKVGSALLVDAESARINRAWLETLVEDLLRLRGRGQRVILVSSGAIALGRRRLGLKHGTLRLEESQATAEIRYGDNDRLAARVAQMTGADCLVLLSDVAGLFSADPNRDPSARLVREVRQLTPEIEAMGGRSASQLGSGGMAAKIAAARIALAAGCHMCIAAGAPRHPLRRIEEGAECTWFIPTATPAAARKQWIAGTLRPAGAITIDAGALRALLEGRSLLPAGVTGTRGRFDRGDTVSVLASDGAEIARGIIAYSDGDAARIMGRKSSEIAELLGFRGRDEMIHRDDLVILRHESAGVSEGPARL